MPSLVHEDGHPGLFPSHTYGAHDDGVPAATAAQVPVVHVAQAPVHAEPQHVEPTQFPLAHWSPASHAVPLALLPAQTPAGQSPLRHWSAAVQGDP